MSSPRSGVYLAASAYLIWGLFPIYFKQVRAAPPAEILAHRIVWSVAFLVGVLLVLRQWSWLGKAIRQPKVLGIFAASAVLLALNWLTYIWAVNNDRVVDSSLGYFITPLVSILLGQMFLHEKLRKGQWGAVALAAIGVLWLTVDARQLPWIAIVLAITFGSYGLLRKIASLGALEGLALETFVLFPVAAAYALFLVQSANSAFVQGSTSLQLLIVASGPITAIPLIMFAAGARRIKLATLGFLQYIAPSLQFAVGTLVYGESMSAGRLAGFAIIWIALAVYTAESLIAHRPVSTTPPE
jgi:chloramphenicol-sensitive protein RarD